MKKPQFIVAAPTSNAGKTSLTLGLLRACKNRGIDIQPFKSGPDYIDPMFHQLACHKTGINLDLFMMEQAHLKANYTHCMQVPEVACIEGVMGLFDGSIKAEGSTASLAKLLDIPVILVVDAHAVAYSVAPLLYGFKNFDPGLNLAGVVFNRVNSESHYRFLTDACHDVGIAPLGRLPFLSHCEIPSRHLGLSIDQLPQYDGAIDEFAKAVEQHVPIDPLLDLCMRPIEPLQTTPPPPLVSTMKIAVARDDAFNFCYQQNIDAFRQLGKIVFFSPLHDSALPTADLVYLPGGYPECHLQELAANDAMQQNIKEYVEASGRIFAECGGMMYLGKSIIDETGKTFKMTGVFDFSTSMLPKKLKMGYRRIYMNGTELKGHEFHYSTIINDENITTIGRIGNARNQKVDSQLYKYKNVLASYIHFYLGETSQLQHLLSTI
ncbi:cobyrinate a,c-diamide synthase [uncultured Microscilla sp.]|uniref:cobyrinate a,c-diamide synthase n=1 Tax=uncultured Microscilla sp. TaxID=432653 RepID=UPI0026372368|nr:cobyrinate a,c-diamide synthase [uncultured Microscilla sp.]